MRLLICLLFLSGMLRGFAQSSGVLSDTVVCKGNATQQYALYLPVNYNAEKKYPLLLFFEPGARATEPLKLYRSLADQHNVVMACSYQSRNGQFDASLKAGYAMVKDVTSRFSIDPSSVWVSGFSGGARVASSLAIDDPQFAGVIACGATFPPGKKITASRKIPYAMVIGEQDMNYLETFQAQEYLQSISNPERLILCKGGHRWPPAHVYEEALRWQMLKKKFLTPEETAQWYSLRMENIKTQIDSGYWYDAQREAAQVRNDFSGITDIQQADSLLTAMSQNKQVTRQKKEAERFLETEQTWRTKFYEQYDKALRIAHTDSAFRENHWTPFRAEIKRFRSDKEKSKRLLGERLYDFSWRLCAEQGSNFMEMKYDAPALLAFQVWSVLTPEDPRPLVSIAMVKAISGLQDESLQYLKRAIEKGYKNKTFLERNEAFRSVQDLPAFQKLLQQI